MAIASIISYIKSTSNLEEFIAGETGILPGHLLTIYNGTCLKYAHPSPDATAFVCIEDTSSGKEVWQEYSPGETVYCRRLRTGDVVYLRFGGAGTKTTFSGEPVKPSTTIDGNIEPGTWDNHIGVALDYSVVGPGQDIPILVQIKNL